MTGNGKTAVIGVFILLLQMTFMPLIAIGEFVPDIVLLWVVTLGIRHGHIAAMLFGFAAGLLQDASTTQFLGLAALSKSVAGFVAGYFFNENTYEQTLGSYRLIVAVAAIDVIHNLVYYGIFYQGLDVPLVASVLQSSVGVALYTSIVAVLPMFAYARTFHTQWTQ